MSAIKSLTVLVASVAFLSCTRAPSGPPNVVVISIDTLRADHLGTYGYARPTSPNIDALARDGAMFEKAYSPTSWTLPGHASMLTGVSPYRHGAVAPGTRIREDVPTLAELLRARDYKTAAWINAPFVSARYGFNRGFDSFVERYQRPRDPEAYQRLVLDALDAMQERPVFLFIHYMNVHSPYRPPPEYNRFAPPDSGGQEVLLKPRGLKEANLLGLARSLAAGTTTLSPEELSLLVDLYDGEILAMDAKIGELMKAIRERLGPNTFVVLTSDHGEEFLEHGGLLHGYTLYDEVLHVPLIVAGPGVAAGTRLPATVSLLDLVPTVLDWLDKAPAAGDAAKPSFEGRSLAAVIGGRGDAVGAAGPLALQTFAATQSVNLRGMRTADEKLIRDELQDRSELFDLRTDPGEKHSVATLPGATTLERDVAQLEVRPSTEPARPDDSTVEALRALGYL